MSNNELQIPYETPLIKIAKTARGLDTTARALWIAYAFVFVVCGCAGVTNMFHGQNPLLGPIAESMGLSEWKWLAVLTGVVLFVTFTLEMVEKALFPIIAAAQLEFSDDFLSLPVSCALESGFNLRRPWSDIASVSIVDGDKVALRFKSKGAASMSLPVIPESQRHLVLLAFDIKCGANQRDSSLEEALSTALDLGACSLPVVWQGSVNRHFLGTTFTPLKVDASCHNGSLVIRRLIATRNFSATYLAQQTDAGLYVIKELALPDAMIASGRRARSNMKRELETPLNDEKHRVMRVLDFFKEQSRDYIVYEYAPGESLRDIVCQSGPVAEKTAIEWSHQIASILETLHQNQPVIVHGNLSPDDLIWKDGQLFLIDCGVANRYLSAAAGGFAGKPSYASPEYLQGERLPVNDLYSLGGILFFLLTGKDPVALTQSRTGLNASTDSLIGQLTSPDPAERIESAGRAKAAIIARLEQLQPHMVHNE